MEDLPRAVRCFEWDSYRRGRHVLDGSRTREGGTHWDPADPPVDGTTSTSTAAERMDTAPP